MEDPDLTPLRLASLRDARAVLRDGQALRREAAEHGYLFFHQLIEPADVLALRSHVLDVCREFGWLDETAPTIAGVARAGINVGAYDDPQWTSLQCRVHPLPEFDRLRNHAAVIGVLELLYDAAVVCGRGDTCRVFSPYSSGSTTPAHQDYHYVRGDMRLWTVWIPLGDCPRELGGLAVLPGSQRHGLARHAGEGSGKQGVDVDAVDTWTTTDFACGDVLMFNCLTVHRALENRTPDRLRVSADFRYVPASLA